MNALTLTARSTQPPDEFGPQRTAALPDRIVERIFARMFGLYGSLWLDRWRSAGGETAGVALAKQTWAIELAGFGDQLHAIGRALDACADLQFPPTLPEFRALCRQHYQRPAEPVYEKRGPLQLSGPQAAKVREAFERLSVPAVQDPLAWARRPRSRAAVGLLCDAIAQGREVTRLAPILRELVEANNEHVTARARRIVQDMDA